ncbi:MAG: hypothetical protein AABY22_37150 [Nanoarchaeota archaeon]
MALTKKEKLIGFFAFSAILAFLIGVVAKSVGLGAKGFDAPAVLSQYFFYANGVAFLIIASLFFIERLIFKGDSKYGDGLAYYHTGELPSIKTAIFDNPFRLFLGSAIIFSLFGLFTGLNQTTFTGIGSLEQQFTKTGQLTFSAILIPISENLDAAAVIAFTIFITRFFARKYNWTKLNFQTTAIFAVVILVGVFGIINHTLRYQISDIALATVFFFWAIGGLITVLTGSFIPFWVMHISNNLFFDLTKSFSNDVVITYTIGIILLMTLMFGLTFIKKGK